MKIYDLPLQTRLRRAELKRQRYLANPQQRLHAINKDRARRGYEVVGCLSECKLRLPA